MPTIDDVRRDLRAELAELKVKLHQVQNSNAERLRAAFNKAAKANHPDNNPGDPDAPHRFRWIVRAHDILGDERQPATYDWLLAVANRQPGVRSKRLFFSFEVRSLLPNAIAGAVISLVSIGAFLACEHASGVAIIPARVQEMSARASALTAAMPAQPSDRIGRATPRQELDDHTVSNKAEAHDAAKEMIAPGAAADTGTTSAIANVEAMDARYYRQQGSLAYHSGDLSLALVDFDLAIDLDPNFSDAFIDRAIVFRRMGNLKRALADVAQAKRVDDLGRSQALAFKPRQTAPLR